MNTILCDDLDGDGKPELLLAGNFYGFKPELGRQDASYGQVYRLGKNGFTFFDSHKSGVKLKGQVRSSLAIKNARGEKFYMLGLNDQPVVVLKPLLR
ncbi:MAG: hypothetical protein INR69_21885 [Mucilaginibacter polytrichastri]|nr:hypothetical protein [Mucilaginibacter polytrichastri]